MEFKQAHQEYMQRFNSSLLKLNDLDLAKKRLSYSRWKVSENLDKLLFEFETNVKKNDAQVLWCPDAASCLDNLNKQLKSFDKIKFFKHKAVRHFVNASSLILPENSEDPEVVVIGAKFIMANSGNFYSSFQNLEDFNKIINAKKIIVIAGIDSVLALQSELLIAKQLYAIYETGNLSYEAEILSRPGRARGFNSEIVLLLTDLKKSSLLEHAFHRPLFSLLNFDLPPVCPMQAKDYQTDSWTQTNSLDSVLSAMMHGMKDNRRAIEGNYGLRTLSQFIPYDLDLYEQILEARAYLNGDEKLTALTKVFDANKSGIINKPKKFNDAERFKKYAERNFYGKLV